MKIFLHSFQVVVYPMFRSRLLYILFCQVFYSFISTAQLNNLKIPVTDHFFFRPGDSSNKLVIHTIIITGNRKTKTYIILRELPFRIGDSIIIQNMNERLEKARQLVYNTTLFNEVKISPVILSAYEMNVNVEVKERWYVFPIPQFKFVDRNFNEWIKTYKASLQHVNYGMKFVHYNLSGRKDVLRIYLLDGYSRNYSLSYSAPYSNPSLTEGFSAGTGFSQNREIAYRTDQNNHLIFYPPDSIKKFKNEFVSSQSYIVGSYSSRRGYYDRHSITMGWVHQKISDSILKVSMNPGYFNNNRHSASYLDIVYNYYHTDLDNVLYALKGVSASFALTKRGLGFTGGINILSLEGSYNRYMPLGHHWYASFGLNASIKVPFKQAYINQRGLGYGDNYLRGLEYYVIDGVVTGLMKNTLRKKIVSFSLPFPFKSRLYKQIPVAIYAKTFGDIGYAYNKPGFTGKFNNKLLYTGGFGIDILTFYDVNLRLEYSFNQLGEKGLFLHTQSGF